MVIKGLIVIFCLLSLQPAVAQEDFYGHQLPKFEGGVALGYFHIPRYPGSDENREIYLPLPFFIYRGDVVRADRDGGLRGRFLRGKAYEFDVSVGAAFASDSDENKARAGMPDLDWIGEVGPRLRIFVFRNSLSRLDFNFPVRHVFSTNFTSRWNARGFVFNPELEFRRRTTFTKNASVVLSWDFTSATKELMDYFYTVEASQATATRPAFDAKPGYFSSSFSAFFIKAFHENKVNVFTGFTTTSYDQAKNEDSPLMKDKYTTSYYLGMTYNFLASKEMVTEVRLQDADEAASTSGAKP